MKRIITLAAFLGISGTSVFADVAGDFDKTFSTCQAKTKNLGNYEDLFPTKKPKDPLAMDKKTYLSTVTQLKSYISDKLAKAGSMLGKLKSMKDQSSKEYKDTQMKLGEEIQAVAGGCKNMSDAIIAAIKNAQAVKDSKIRKK